MSKKNITKIIIAKNLSLKTHYMPWMQRLLIYAYRCIIGLNLEKPKALLKFIV